MDATYPLTVLYDAACPVCALEMDHLRQRSTDGRLVFVDISAPGFDPAAYGRSAWRSARRGPVNCRRLGRRTPGRRAS